jgi:hypothetical protein
LHFILALNVFFLQPAHGGHLAISAIFTKDNEWPTAYFVGHTSTCRGALFVRREGKPNSTFGDSGEDITGD